jgi:hypothetical protein
MVKRPKYITRTVKETAREVYFDRRSIGYLYYSEQVTIDSVLRYPVHIMGKPESNEENKQYLVVKPGRERLESPGRS